MLEEKKIIEKNNEKYIVLSVTMLQDEKYAFVTKLDESYNPTEENYILKEENNEIIYLTDEKTIQDLLKVFQEKKKKKILEGGIL